MREQRMLGVLGLGCLLLLSGTNPVSADPPAPVSGSISADNGHFEPIGQIGNVVFFEHEDTHQLTGDIQGDWLEVGILALDVVTGEGFFMAEGEFSGTILGQSGDATLRVHGEVRNFFVTDRGHFVITQGEGGLAGVHAWGTYDYIVGVGGSYTGAAQFDDRR